MQLTQQQAALLVDAHCVDVIVDDPEEWEMLRANNPDLAEAYEALLRIATDE